MKIRTLRRVDKWLGSPLITIIRPLSLLLGILLRRDHSLAFFERKITVIKLLGGGSLFIALPSLLALRRRYPNVKLVLVGQHGTVAYAKLLGVFDEFVVIDSQSPLALLKSSFFALRRTFRSDATVDLEIHSKLTSLFSLLSCSRNRIGFFIEHTSWQKGILTHALFINDSNPIHLFYEQLARFLRADLPSIEEVKQHLLSTNSFSIRPDSQTVETISLGCFSSGLCPEREFSHMQWLKVIQNMSLTSISKIIVLGGRDDVEKAKELCDVLGIGFPEVEISNLAGRLSLKDSVSEILNSDLFLTIDSGLNHIVRYLDMDIVSFWGPTNPRRLLGPASPRSEQIVYQRVFCSPCVHLIIDPPCNGNNICMQLHTDSEVQQPDRTGWTIDITKKSVNE